MMRKIIAISKKDAHYGDRKNIVGKKTDASRLNHIGQGWYQGTSSIPLSGINIHYIYFYRVKLAKRR